MVTRSRSRTSGLNWDGGRCTSSNTCVDSDPLLFLARQLYDRLVPSSSIHSFTTILQCTEVPPSPTAGFKSEYWLPSILFRY